MRINIWQVVLLVSVSGSLRASQENHDLESAAGKVSYMTIASAAGNFEAVSVGRINYSIEQSFLGKPTSSVVFEGPPPRGTVSAENRFDKRYLYIYSDHNASANHFKPVGYMGDVDDIRLNEASHEDPADGPTCIKISYLATGIGGHEWAGVYWLEPNSNWGYKPGGYDLTNMQRLTFWARGAQGNEQIAVFKVGGVGGTHADSGVSEIGPIHLTKDWQQYAIDLGDLDLSKISGGFAWSTARTDNLEAITFYLDEIRFER
jgi:hypothetical protein